MWRNGSLTVRGLTAVLAILLALFFQLSTLITDVFHPKYFLVILLFLAIAPIFVATLRRNWLENKTYFASLYAWILVSILSPILFARNFWKDVLDHHDSTTTFSAVAMTLLLQSLLVGLALSINKEFWQIGGRWDDLTWNPSTLLKKLLER